MGLMVTGICWSTSDIEASVPPHLFTPIDSVWIEKPPVLGETFTVFICFSVNTSYVDSVMLQGSAFESRHREPLMDVRRVLQCEMGDTLTRSLGFVFDKPGQYEVHLAVKGWYAQDPSARPTGASTRTLRLAIPDSGYGQVVNRFSQSVSTERKTLKEGKLIFWGDLVITPSGDTLWPTILPADSDVAPDSVDRPEGSNKPGGAVQVVPTLYPLARIDSIWVTSAPRVGDSVEVFIRFAVPSAYTDSVQVAGSYYAKSERDGHGEASLTIPISHSDTHVGSLPIAFPDTVVTSLKFLFREAGAIFSHHASL